MVRLRSFFLLSFAILYCSPAPAQNPSLLPPAEYKTPPIGTTFTWASADGQKSLDSTITERDGFLIRGTRSDRNKPWSEFTHFCRYCTKWSYDESKVTSIWPLKVGNKTTFVRKDKKRNRYWTNTIEVTGIQTITVPAGTFDTYVVELTSKAGSNTWDGRWTYWYAPNLGWTIKRTGKETGREPWTWHVTAIDGEQGIHASTLVPPSAFPDQISFSRQLPPAPDEGPVTEIGAVTAVKTYAYGTLPGANRSALYARDDMFSRQLLETVRGGGLHALFADETDLRMGPSSCLRLDRYVYNPDPTAQELSVAFVSGIFRYISGKMNNQKVVLVTPDVAIGIRGTDFIVSVDSNGTAVSVLEGEVELTPLGGGASTVVGVNQVATIGGTSVSTVDVDEVDVPADLGEGGCG